MIGRDHSRLRGKVALVPANSATGSWLDSSGSEACKKMKGQRVLAAKARMRGDGPPYVKVGRNIRYTQAGISPSTSET